HFLTFDLQKAIVHPKLSHTLGAQSAAGLGDFVFMMGEHKVDPSPMNIELILLRIIALKTATKRLQQLSHRHGRAFNMPTWPPDNLDSGGRRPTRFTVF